MKVRIMFTIIFAIAALGSIAMSATVYSSNLLSASVTPGVSLYFIAGAIAFSMLTGITIKGASKMYQ